MYLRDCQTDTHSPFFVIQEQYRAPVAEKVPISHKVIDEMMRDGRFHLDQLKFRISRHHASSEIFICLKDKTSYLPISGFPRTLQQESTRKGIETANTISPLLPTLLALFSGDLYVDTIVKS